MRMTSLGSACRRAKVVCDTREFSRAPWPVPSLGAGREADGSLLTRSSAEAEASAPPLARPASADLPAVDDSAKGAGGTDEGEGAFRRPGDASASRSLRLE